MAMLDPNAPIPCIKKIKKLKPYLLENTNEIVYPIEKVVFLDKNIDDKYYTIKKIIIDEKKNITIKQNKYSLFSNDFYITFMPMGELITEKDIKKIKIFKLTLKNHILFKHKNKKENILKKILTNFFSLKKRN